MAPHSSTLAWKIPWTEEPGRLQSMRSLRVGHYWATSLSLFTLMHWRRKWQPTPVFLPGESQGWGEPGGLPSVGSPRVGHDWSNLAAAAAAAASRPKDAGWSPSYSCCIYQTDPWKIQENPDMIVDYWKLTQIATTIAPVVFVAEANWHKFGYMHEIIYLANLFFSILLEKERIKKSWYSLSVDNSVHTSAVSPWNYVNSFSLWHGTVKRDLGCLMESLLINVCSIYPV